ncbi:hypothetical protein AMS68_007515 [Peltaster fructicola]|uniref:Major facilitator superfamily (MFS) profile domain-containing protein n=1 Tax=Peltaster fructicola TaxID=286661 RepID=A0A6H0Y582_9PEZI|nr:hypothetical protein AMS68_007515 [Peltaster fructicola]
MSTLDIADVPTTKEPIASGGIEVQAQDSSDAASINTPAQAGVQDIEAVTTVWSTKALVFAYVLIWITYFVEGMLSGTNAALAPFVTSTYADHALTPTVSILSAIIGGVTNFTIAKMLDVWGRPQGFAVCVIIATIGLVMMAKTQSVEMYAAAQVFYAVGNNGLQYTLSVFVADTSSLHNRGLMQAFAYSPNMITCWLAGPISTAFLDDNGPGWHWAFGMFAFLVPAVTLPLFGLIIFHHNKAKRQLALPTQQGSRTVLQSALHYFHEFDAVGSFTLWRCGTVPTAFQSLHHPSNRLVITTHHLSFGVWRRTTDRFRHMGALFARITFIPYALLKNRTILGACFLSATLFFSYFVWNSYFSSFLLVVNDLSVTNASYVVQIYTVGSVLASIAVGILIHYTGRFKPVTLYFAVPLSILGTGLMIYFRTPDGYIGYIVMCQIFIAFAAGTIIICDEIAILACVQHQHIAAVLAALGLFGNVGGAIGLTVAAAIWQGVFPQRLLQYLPDDALDNFLLIYGDLSTQLSYEVGSPTRIAIQQAYGDAQTDMLIAATAVWAFGLVAVLLWRDIKVTGVKQVKGHVV